MHELSKEEERYFRTLQKLDPSDDMRRIVEHAKQDLRERETHVVRGLTRVKGFTAE